MCDSFWPHGLQHGRLPCPSLSSGICSDSCALRQHCYLNISSYIAPFAFSLSKIRVFSSELVFHIRWPKYWSFSLFSVQFSQSVMSDSVTSWIAACQASLSITNSQRLLKLMSIKSVMLSNHFIRCHLFILLPSIFPSIRVFFSLFFKSGGQSIGALASASVLPMNIQDWFLLELTGLISLSSKGLSRIFSNTTTQNHQFFNLVLEIHKSRKLVTSLFLHDKQNSLTQYFAFSTTFIVLLLLIMIILSLSFNELIHIDELAWKQNKNLIFINYYFPVSQR